MSIFAVLSRAANPTLEAKIKEKFPNDNYVFSSNQWLICGGGTSKEISEQLELLDKDKNLTAVVFTISSYFGKESPDLWEWIKVKWEKSFD